MIKNLLSISYSNKLISGFIINSRRGNLVSAFIAPLIVVFSLYGELPILNLSVWFSIHVSIFILRLNLSKKIEANLPKITSMKAFDKQRRDKQQIYFNLYIISSMMTGFLYGILSFGLNLHDVSVINVFIIATIVLALTAGAISTLGFVFISFFGFMVFAIVPFIMAMIYHGGTDHYTLALIFIMFLVVHLNSGFRLFNSYKDSFNLEEKFETIFNKSSDGISIIKNSKYVECNQTVLKLFGYEGDMKKYMDTPLLKLSPPKQPDGANSMRKMLSMLKKAFNQTITFEWQHTYRDGRLFWVEITLRSMVINGEKIIHGVWRDIDARKKAEQALEDLNNSLELKVKEGIEKNKLKDQQLLQQSRLAQMGEMISMIAHQWRQPLNAISLTSYNLSFKCMLGDMDKEYFEKELSLIDGYSQHLSKTIDDFRNFFKDDKVKQSSSLDSIIESTLNIVKVSTENKNIKIITKLNSAKPIQTYPNEVKQVVLNLIKNAEDVLLENDVLKPTITITTDENCICISDNAGGIPEDIKDKIFDPYFSTKKEKDGTGLGLYMSKTIIEDHCDASLNAYNDKDGAVFKIEFKQENT